MTDSSTRSFDVDGTVSPEPIHVSRGTGPDGKARLIVDHRPSVNPMSFLSPVWEQKLLKMLTPVHIQEIGIDGATFTIFFKEIRGITAELKDMYENHLRTISGASTVKPASRAETEDQVVYIGGLAFRRKPKSERVSLPPSDPSCFGIGASRVRAMRAGVDAVRHQMHFAPHELIGAPA